MQPYNFTLKNISWHDEGPVEEQTLTNKTTNEQFSVSVKKEENKEYAGVFTITIERGMTTKKK